MFNKILIANRGEIACRVAATARRMGIRTVAVYSDVDRDAKHVAACDEAIYIGGAAPKDSYLRGDAILAAAIATGAKAVHPGYGFLSENAAFAQACDYAGIVFIGPPASAIAAMGSKAAAKALMGAAGVPLTAGYHGENQDAAFLQAQAASIGYPVMIKATAGGGGKGMRVVTQHEDFLTLLAGCQREAKNAFGDDRVLIETYVQTPRHIEVQVFADTQGNAVYLFERDCSVQRRHQKVIEEAPAPHMTATVRRELGEAAVAAAKAVGYVGAGTVEFIADKNVADNGKFYFMEMNTRLQVEHPVTEMITGQDLVEWQLRVAAGQRLPLLQDELRLRGHAFEARIYAENTAKGFLPSIGKLSHLVFPHHVSFVGQNRAGEIPVRVDSGVRAGDTITPHYDPMIAKLIVWGEDRAQALARLSGALAQTQVVGVHSNVAFLQALAHNAAFAEGDVHTGLIEQERETLFAQVEPFNAAAVLLAVSATLQHEQTTSFATSTTNSCAAWRLGGAGTMRVLELQTQLLAEDDLISALSVNLRYPVPHGSQNYWANWVDSQSGQDISHEFTFDFDTLKQQYRVQAETNTLCGSVIAEAAVTGTKLIIFAEGQRSEITVCNPFYRAQTDAPSAGKLTAPMPGKIVAHLVKLGETVAAGAPLLVMEAMKMEHTMTAPAAGKVSAWCFAVGEQVTDGAQLLEFEVNP